MRITTMRFCAAGLLCSFFGVVPAAAQEIPPDANPVEPETWSAHLQVTFVDQYHPGFSSAYRGAESLDPGSRGMETFAASGSLGVRLWDGGEAYADPEVDQGFGLNGTFGVAGFTSGEAYKVGAVDPYFRLHRLFVRQTFDLGGDPDPVPSSYNQLASERTTDNVVVTFGKFSVVDVFDNNAFAHDPGNDFLNWSIVDSGAYDYAADAWGFTYGGTVEWTQAWWTLRAGLVDLSRVPNTTKLVRGLGQYEIVTEAEERHTLLGVDGRVRLLGFVNRGRMGTYNAAIALAEATNSVPNTALVRRGADRPGFAVNAEQSILDDLGAFVRLSMNDGSEEAFEFTEINRSLALGLSLQGNRWQRPNDTVGLAVVGNQISHSAERYLALGGMGILIGDGALAHHGTEQVLETYYKATLTDWFAVSGDYQLVVNPAYNRDRGPVSVLSARLHVQI